jgi:bifunctional non-homologous end joining protein LigD
MITLAVSDGSRTGMHCSMGELRTYGRKRNFRRTPEPKPSRAKPAKRLRFVIQKHAASSLHYDVRLEAGGVMKSWAVPKGPSLNPATKRLAIPTEDHPISYNRFEGVIPDGEYGAGEVIVWDRGWYANRSDTSPQRAIAKGALTFELHGEKLKGRWALRRIGNARNWILVKMKDEQAKRTGDITKERPESAITGRTIEQIARGA